MKREADFSDPLRELGDCHHRVVRCLHVLGAVAGQKGGSALGERERASLTASLRYFREELPKHTEDEEESLFPRLRSAPGPEAGAVLARIETLEQEHECAGGHHEAIDRLGRLWLREGRLGVQDARRLATLVRELADLYRHHIGIEDREIFPFAAAVLSEGERAAMGEEMAMRRGLVTEVIAKG